MSMKNQAAIKVSRDLLEVDLTSKTQALTYRLQTILNIINSPYYIKESLLAIHSLVEPILHQEVNDARENFRFLVLARMKKEAKALGVELKPLYFSKAELYNKIVFPKEVDDYSPINGSSSPHVEQDHSHLRTRLS